MQARKDALKVAVSFGYAHLDDDRDQLAGGAGTNLNVDAGLLPFGLGREALAAAVDDSACKWVYQHAEVGSWGAEEEAVPHMETSLLLPLYGRMKASPVAPKGYTGGKGRVGKGQQGMTGNTAVSTRLRSAAQALVSAAEAAAKNGSRLDSAEMARLRRDVVLARAQDRHDGQLQ